MSYNVSIYSNLSIASEEKDILTVGYIFIVANGLLIGVLNIFLNSFVLANIGTEHSDFDVTRTFLRHNALADAIAGVLAIYQNIHNIILYQDFQECVARNSFLVAAILATMLIIFGLNIERYIRITLPLRYMTIITPTVVNTYLIVAWSIPAAFALIPNFLWINAPHPSEICQFFLVFGRTYFICLNMCTATTVFGQIFMYLHIFIIAVSKIVKDRRAVGPKDRQGALLEWWKPAKVVLCIVGVNLCTIVPMCKYIFYYKSFKYIFKSISSGEGIYVCKTCIRLLFNENEIKYI